jgi:MinD superfamily P-loop ATPase
MDPKIKSEENFSGGSRAKIITDKCTGCAGCFQICRFEAVKESSDGKTYFIDPIACEGCGVCAWFCPEKAIDFSPAINGQAFISDTRHGTMAHAKLGIAEENSGKLVSTVRENAKKKAEEENTGLIIIDGSPGIGCPVIASLTGADFVLVVTEPTLSGLHDMERVAKLINHFNIPGFACVNKWDLNPEITQKIEQAAKQHGLTAAGRVCYDKTVTDAQIKRKSVVEYTDKGSSKDIVKLWNKIKKEIEGK